MLSCENMHVSKFKLYATNDIIIFYTRTNVFAFILIVIVERWQGREGRDDMQQKSLARIELGML